MEKHSVSVIRVEVRLEEVDCVHRFRKELGQGITQSEPRDKGGDLKTIRANRNNPHVGIREEIWIWR
jgi:hypothetical protein